jgi:alpha-N-arabinofuranosidase
MKAVDPAIQIGAVLKDLRWNEAVLDLIRDKIDFGIVHLYPTPAWGKSLEKMNPEDIFKTSLAIPVVKYGHDIEMTLRLLKKKAGRDVPLAVTEYNGGFVQDKPVPYRHSLGNALVNAELLRVFMMPENDILMANHWNFMNEYWGMVANGFNGDYGALTRPYYKRPNYYVFEMYHQHFGDVLLAVDARSDTYDVSRYPFLKDLVRRLKTGTLTGKNLLLDNWRITEFAGARTREQNGVLEIDFEAPEQFNYYHSTKPADVDPGSYYRLSGYIKTEGLIDDAGVSLEAQDARGWSKIRSAAGTAKVRGDTDWQYVETIYDTLPDARAVNVIARRIGEEGPLRGKAFFKDVKLEKFVPSVDTRIPYLSVNASRSQAGNKVYLMVINKNMDEAMTSTIDLQNFAPASKGGAWVLNGPAVDATNEKKRDNVKVTQYEFAVNNNPFEFTFEPHSLTAMEISGVLAPIIFTKTLVKYMPEGAKFILGKP